MTKRNRNISLARAIERGQLTLTLSILATCAIGFIINNYFLAKISTQKTIDSTVRMLTEGLAAPLMFQDKKETLHALESLKNHPIVTEATISDLSGNIIATFPEILSSQKGKYLGPKLRYPIIYQNEQQGVLSLEIRDDFELLNWYGYGAIAFLALMVGFFVAQFVRKGILNEIVDQISGILTVVKQISESKQYSHRVLKSETFKPSIVEIEELAIEFDFMLETVEAILHQITEMNESLEKTIEERTSELKEAHATLVQTSKLSALGEMAAGVAHEINNPLAIISSSISLLTKFRNDEEKFGSKISSVEKAVIRIEKIVKGLKKFSRQSQTNDRKIESLKLIVNEALFMTESKAKNNLTSIEATVPENLFIYCDCVEIEQVLINLISNGIDAIKKQSEKWVKINGFLDSEQVVLQVVDSGLGIPQEIENKLFQPFFTTKPVGEGTGLGLSITKGILEDHHASIRINREFKNTCFEIRFQKVER